MAKNVWLGGLGVVEAPNKCTETAHCESFVMDKVVFGQYNNWGVYPAIFQYNILLCCIHKGLYGLQ